MTKNFDQTKHRRGSSLPEQEKGREPDKALNEWVRGLRSMPRKAGRKKANSDTTESGSKESKHSEEDSRWQDDGGEGA